MSYNSKRTITNTIAGIVLVIVYIFYALGEKSPAPDDLKAWAILLLIFIGVGIVAIIVIQILFHIALAIGISARKDEGECNTFERIMASETTEDERDKLIGMKSSHVSNIIAGAGAIVMLIALACGVSGVAAIHILFAAFAVGSIVSGFVSIHFYEKGV